MTQIQLKSTIDVEYVQHIGSDDMCAHAAWVSSKGARDSFKDAPNVQHRDKVLTALVTKRHGAPFECGGLTIRVHAPIKVWREWHRHRIGWSYNEESGRYKQLDPIFYVPPPDRPLIEAPDFKPMNPVFVPAAKEQYDVIVRLLAFGYEHAYAQYEDLLRWHVDKGVARDVLGVGIYSTCYCTCNPRSIMHFLELRTMKEAAKRPSKPLWEIAKAAEQLESIFAHLWPKTYELWNANGRMAP